MIGHEIGHGFDDQGSQYDGDGKLNNWWTDEDRKNFEARTGALIAQYNGFVPQQLAEKYADEPDKAPHVNGALTIGENIGDLGGVNIALKAYAFALGKAAGKADVEEDGSPAAIKALLDTAPEMDGFTGLQRFFLSYAPSGVPRTVTNWPSSTCRSTRIRRPNSAPTASPAMWISSMMRSTSLRRRHVAGP